MEGGPSLDHPYSTVVMMLGQIRSMIVRNGCLSACGEMGDWEPLILSVYFGEAPITFNVGLLPAVSGYVVR